MRREAPVRFLGGGGAAMHCCYPTNGHKPPFKIFLHSSHSPDFITFDMQNFRPSVLSSHMQTVCPSRP
jgi:hypothetical protein